MARKIGSRYTANQILGRGSAGTVWLGEGPQGPVAIKTLREDLACDQELVERFVQERTALLGLDHPHVVGVRDLVVDGDELALVMELVRGTDLRTRLTRERRLAPEAAVAITADIAEALAAAHAAGVVHRDVKPENVLLDMQGPLGPGGAHPALLTDFGVAKLIDSSRRAPERGTAPQGRPGAHRIMGTPDYLAPEIIEGLPSRAPVDIYALATVLYELLAGFTPFGGGHPGAVLRRHVTETVVPLPGIPEELWQLIVRCLAKGPASRLRAGELAEQLREQLPLLRGMPQLEVDGPGDEYEGEYEGEGEYGTVAAHGGGDVTTGSAEGAAGSHGRLGGAGHARGAAGNPGAPARGAVPLVPGAVPDSSRETHTSMRVPAADELAGGAHGTARAPRAVGAPRPGSARNRMVTRRRRLTVSVAAFVLVAAAGIGAWAASAPGDEEGGTQDSGSSAPDAP